MRSVLTMRNSVVGNNVHRWLDRNEFRGFAISDNRAPVIFINTADTPQAQIFTLLHEFAHLLLGESGVSDLSPRNPRKIERVCNRLAAEFLVPSADFSELWRSDLKDWQANLPVLARHFHVSQWVIASEALSGRMLLRDASRLIGVRPEKIKGFAREELGF